MAFSRPLHLYEEIMLIVLRDEKGTIAASTYPYALAGAMLAELVLEKRIEIEVVKKKKFAKVVNPSPTGEPLLDEALAKIAAAKKRATLQDWVMKLSGMKRLKERVAGELVGRGILRVDRSKILGIFTRTVYPEVDPGPEHEVIGRVEAAIFGDAAAVDPRTAVLISLAKGADLLRLIVDKKRLKERKARLDKIVNGELIGAATREAVEAVQAAIVVAVIASTIVASSSHH